MHKLQADLLLVTATSGEIQKCIFIFHEATMTANEATQYLLDAILSRFEKSVKQTV